MRLLATRAEAWDAGFTKVFDMFIFYFVKKQFCTLFVHHISFIRLPDSPNLSQSEFSPLELLFFLGVYPTFTDPYGGVPCVAPGLLISAIRKHRASLEAAHLRAESEDVWAPGHVSTVQYGSK